MRSAAIGIVCALALVAACVASVMGQTPNQPARKLAPKRAWDPVAIGDCTTPALPQTLPMPWIARAEDRLTWCVDGATTTQASSSSYLITVRGLAGAGALPNVSDVLAHACLSVPAGSAVPCFAPLPGTVYQRLRNLGPHFVSIIRTSGGIDSEPSPVLQLETPGCRIVDLDVSPPTLLEQVAPIFGFEPAAAPPEQPEQLPTTATGYLARRLSLNTPNFALALGTLRNAGWRVEWWRTQFEAPNPPTSSGGGHWYLLAWCAGTPQ